MTTSRELAILHRLVNDHVPKGDKNVMFLRETDM